MTSFTLRPYRLSDVSEVYAAADESREMIAKWMGWMTEEYSRADTAAWVEHAIQSWHQGDAYEHLIIDSTTGSIVGSCGLNHLNRVNGVCNLGYWVRQSRLGEGAALQAAWRLRDFGFQALGLNRLEIVVAVGNHYSRAVAAGTGAVYEGVQQMRLKVGDVAHDAHMYALLRPTSVRAPHATKDPIDGI
jgi:ribosomal-protein-serine acetyltransferase